MVKADNGIKITGKEPPKIGVYICWCGVNIGGVVDVPKLCEYARTLPNVALASEYKFMCSDIGQGMIMEDIRAGKVNRVVVSACSPRMHEETFRRACEEGGLNKYLFEQANIREHCTWVTMNDVPGATRIAKDHIRMAVAKSGQLKPLKITTVKVEPATLVVGAGIAGINAALDLANSGYKVYLVEKSPTVGGHMAQLDKTFPTMDCSSCITTPKMSEVARNPNIELMTYSEVVSLDGYVGNFQVRIEKYPHYIDQNTCTGCGHCIDICPVECANEFDLGMKPRKAIYLSFPQAVPGEYTIDMKHCIRCGICKEACPTDAVRYDDKPEYVDVKVGTIILATGFQPYDARRMGQYGFGRHKNVINALQMERLLSSYGPTEGKVKRPSDLKEPKSIVWVQCVGSREFTGKGRKYCSRVCCMYATKQARSYKEKHPDTQIFIFYIDLRAFGKGYEEFYNDTAKNYGIKFIRGRVAEILEGENDNLIIRAEDTTLQRPIELEVDMVVLSIGLEPREDIDDIARIFNVTATKTEDGFLMEAHPKLRPVDTLTEGIFVAGNVVGPKDIPDTVAQAKAAASSAATLMSQKEVEIIPYYATVLDYKCAGCKSCIGLCPFNAITFNEIEKVAIINDILCKGCGTCVAACPSKAIIQNHFDDAQILPMIETAILKKPKQEEVEVE
ncbi:MAG: 4Fe-4S binding protein [Promethearchaeota archaeon]